ncbi:6339_t:CDS:10 [Ambispora gerdemannii]|uniref:6339_t:CDS:1 n=1 Tax=Ambispora gerdemannii TaxID=144530 RepID=A0A9N8Z3B1_9GLOM|nr:6339_t:CDS:10 [Ambispora gerdemannii]
MSKEQPINIAGTQIPVTAVHGDIDIPAVLRFPPFVDWVNALSKETHDDLEKELEVKKVEIQNVDYFGPKLGFIKFKIDARLKENGKNIPGIVFMRGGSVAVLLILRSKENDGSIVSEHVVLTVQPRIAVPSFGFPELPAGMLDGSGNFAGKASEEIKEETGLEIKDHELIDMTGLSFGEKYRGAYPSPGGCDEFMRLCLCIKEMRREQVQELEGRLCGLREHGESITVKLVKLNDLWKIPDMKALSALTLYNELRREVSVFFMNTSHSVTNGNHSSEKNGVHYFNGSGVASNGNDNDIKINSNGRNGSNNDSHVYHMPDSYVNGASPVTPSNGVFDHSKQDPETVIEISPNGRYAKLNTVLGKGAYKVVWKAIDRDEGYEVAWNCFQTTRAEYIELNQEIEILRQVRHPNIINFHYCWYKDAEFIFVTELMTSGTLREYIRKLSLPNPKIVKRWSRQILKGLIYLHSHDPPIIHRDIKCDNIFINGAHGEVKIGDMGTAKMKLGKKYTVIGTPEFMAPEMYEERGYNEKVDIYAFGMCLLEMVTGEYPYSECKNAAQIYKKVIQGTRPESLAKVQDEEILDLINNCLSPENERYTAEQIVVHPFLTVEPEVVLIAADERRTHLKLQVVFKGMDNLSVKFDFKVEKDTAEEVVKEMIDESVLPQKYQQFITHEINRILRDLNKASKDDDSNDEIRHWNSLPGTPPFPGGISPHLPPHNSPGSFALPLTLDRDNSPNSTSSGPVTSDSLRRTQEWQAEELEDILPLKDYPNETPIEDFVHETAVATNRDPEKAKEWTTKLKHQDIMTIGDLRDLLEEDWAGIGLTVFASRALKNALYGKSLRSPGLYPRSMGSSSANISGGEEGL